MNNLPHLLSLVTFTPAIGALLLVLFKVFARSDDKGIVERNAPAVALVTSLFTFALSILMLFEFNPSDPGFQLVEEATWFSGFHYRMGVDGISILLVLLTTFLMPLCFIASMGVIKTRVTEYMVAFLVLETLIIGVFCSLDIVMFYVFFEAGLIPMYLIIGVWGGNNKVYAAFKFFLYTLLGSMLMLIAVIAMIIVAGTSNIVELLAFDFAPGLQIWLWIGFFASFAVKLPMWPVHTWLPDAHVQAPTAGSVILAGVLLKLGGYGFIRFSLPMFPVASQFFAPLVFVLSVIAIIYTSLVAFRQTDMKKLIAYSSVAHMGFVTIGLFAMNFIGLQGAMFQMLSHGVISAALFLIVGVVYDRMHTREIAAYGGLVHRMPVYAAIFLLFTMANVGLPATSGFIGEILTLVAAFQVNTWVAFGATTGVILSAVYALNLYREVIFGELVNEKLAAITDVTRKEILMFAPLIIATLLMGVLPVLVTDITGPAVEALIERIDAGLALAAPIGGAGG